MQKPIGWLWVIGFFSWVAAANAQTPWPSAAVTKFDGTYAFVSETKVNETYTTFRNREHPCPNLSAGPLTIVNGQAWYTSLPGPAGGVLDSGRVGNPGPKEFEGTVGPRGELALRWSAPTANHTNSLPSVIMVNGRIDGTVRARRMSGGCRHDFIWQKEPK